MPPRTRPGATTTRVLSRAIAAGVVAAPLAVAAAWAGSGGAWSSGAPSIASVACAKGCAGLTVVRPGGTLRITGEGMAGAAAVAFLGGPGADDDVRATARRPTARTVEVVVPARARSGPLRVHTAGGAPSNVSDPIEVDVASTLLPAPAPGSGPAVQATVPARKVFLGSRAGARLSLLIRDRRPAAVSVQLVRSADGTVVAAWTPGVLTPGTVRTIAWNGRDLAGKPASSGRYEFRVFTAEATAGADARAAQAADQPPVAAPSFVLVDHQFPVRGKHAYGEADAVFGARRGGHVHQGQDVLAACGTPVVAARGGVVKLRDTERSAGHYLVIDEDGSDLDAVYMHLRRSASVATGARVYTGQAIGQVGRSGAADVCHLHFELWSGAGWQSGGKPFDPLPSLKAWDAQS